MGQIAIMQKFKGQSAIMQNSKAKLQLCKKKNKKINEPICIYAKIDGLYNFKIIEGFNWNYEIFGGKNIVFQKFLS